MVELRYSEFGDNPIIPCSAWLVESGLTMTSTGLFVLKALVNEGLCLRGQCWRFCESVSIQFSLDRPSCLIDRSLEEINLDP